MIRLFRKGPNVDICMTRGDTLKLSITLAHSDGSEYIPVEGDVIRFAAKRRYRDTDPVIEATVPIDTMILTVASSATSDLRFGDYVYDMQITYADGVVDTFMKGMLRLEEEVS